MKEKVQKHVWYYVTFFVVEGSGLVALYYLAADEFLKMLIVSLMALFYILWSILHHSIHHSLTRKIVIEYVLIGLLGIVIVLFFLS